MPSRPARPTRRTSADPGAEGLDIHTDEADLPILEADDDATPISGQPKRASAHDMDDETPTRHNPMGQDAALRPSYSEEIVSDPGHKPAFLYVDRGPGAGQLIPVKQGEIIIGRISTADLRLNHPSVSRSHAQLTRRGDEFTLEDLGSQNGTYVNRRKIRGRTFVSAGDEITVGTALLKLRGPSSDSLTAVPSRARSGMSNAVKVALFAGAVGAGIAATLVYAFIRTTPTAETPAPAEVVAAEAAPVEAAPVARRAVIEEEPVVVDVVKSGARADREMARVPEAAPAAAPVAAKAAPVAAAPALALRKPTAVERAPAAAPAEQAEEAAPAEGYNAAANPQRATILARYESGKVDLAIEAAEAAGDKALTADLVKFRDAFAAGKEAREAGDVAGALKQFGVAQKIDEKLSSGWSAYGPQIKKQMGGVYAAVGAHHLDSGNTAEARKAFQAALKQDPSNPTAKAGMAQLGGAEKPARNSISDAFGDDAPAPEKKAPAKRSAIEDAFGE
jgi:pSer/pThr/pTyr-binding forkhead associated (FHA) protein/tetratricopeptide (TPR) repeat protein